MSHVMCHMSHVTCRMSRVACHIFFFFYSAKVVKLIDGESVINGAYPVFFLVNAYYINSGNGGSIGLSDASIRRAAPTNLAIPVSWLIWQLLPVPHPFPCSSINWTTVFGIGNSCKFNSC